MTARDCIRLAEITRVVLAAPLGVSNCGRLGNAGTSGLVTGIRGLSCGIDSTEIARRMPLILAASDAEAVAVARRVADRRRSIGSQMVNYPKG